MPEHILSLSYGKDSMACLGAIEQLGWPLDRIVTADVWATSPDCNGEIHWLRVVEDVKSPATKTRVYEIKKKLMRERFGIDVREV